MHNLFKPGVSGHQWCLPPLRSFEVCWVSVYLNLTWGFSSDTQVHSLLKINSCQLYFLWVISLVGLTWRDFKQRRPQNRNSTNCQNFHLRILSLKESYPPCTRPVNTRLKKDKRLVIHSCSCIHIKWNNSSAMTTCQKIIELNKIIPFQCACSCTGIHARIIK